MKPLNGCSGLPSSVSGLLNLSDQQLRKRERRAQMSTDPRQAFENHERLKAELRIRGTSLAQIGRDLGISGTSMSLVGLGKHRSKRIERAIADALGTTPEKLYPERYREGGA